MDKEQIKAISESIPMEQRFSVEQIVSAAIESYKAELLKEVGEPVLYAEFAEDGGWLGDASEYAYHLEEPHALYTSDQVAVAVLMATKPLEDQLAAAQEEIELWKNGGYTSLWKQRTEDREAVIERQRLILLELRDQLAKAEQRIAEWQPISTAPKDGTLFLGWVGGERWSSIDGGGSGSAHDVSQVDFCWWRADFNCLGEGYFDNSSGQIGDSQGVTHWMPLPKAPNGASS